MIRINLLPWREQLREERKREFLVTLAVFASVALIFVFITHLIIGNHIRLQETKNQLLTNEIKILDVKIKKIGDLKKQKEQLLARMLIIQQLQHSRPTVVHLFEQFVSLLPSGIYLSHVERSGEKITFKGFAESNTNVSILMRNIKSSSWLANPILTEVKTDDKGGVKVSDFELTMQQR